MKVAACNAAVRVVDEFLEDAKRVELATSGHQDNGKSVGTTETRPKVHA